ncbi:MAG: DUF6134 family protein [Bacteroidota bacterium]
MKQHYFLFLMTLLFAAPSVNAQTLNYDVYYGDSQVGSMKVEKKYDGEKVIMHSHGKVTLSLIFTLELEFIHHAEFREGGLLSSLSKNLRGGDLTDMSSGYQKESVYQNRVNDEIRQMNLPIQFTVLSMYFTEPKGLKTIYSERTGTLLPVRQTSDNQYEVTQYNGHKTRYVYQNGIVKIMEVDHAIATLEFRLRN